MPIIVCGINHKTAPIALREKVIFSAEKLPIYLQDLIANENIREAVLLSTCNRSELYCDADSAQKAFDWFLRQHPECQYELKQALYVYQNHDAVEHMMKVACGLDSMVLGESQILGQMKTAFSESCAAGSVGPLFNRLFQQIFSVAKEVRTTTAIGACPVSISSATVNFVKQISSKPLSEATLLLVGAGDTIQLVLRYLKNDCPKKIIIANRNQERATLLADQYHAHSIALEDLPKALMQADIVISATESTAPVITQAMLANRKNPILMIDIAVPRDIEPEVTSLASVQLFSIDDLKGIIQQNLTGREHAAEKAKEMVDKKSNEFMAWINSLDVVTTTIRSYRKQIEEMCRVELMKSMQQLKLGEDPTEVLKIFAHTFTNKLLHTPSVQLRQAGFEGRLDILQLAQQLFAIPETVSEV